MLTVERIAGGIKTDDPFERLPARIMPYVAMDSLSQPLPLMTGPFRLVGPAEGILESDLVFQWTPSPDIVFDGLCSLHHVEMGMDAHWALIPEASDLEIPILLTNTVPLVGPTQVRGLVNGSVSLGEASFEVLRFSLANFPRYLGSPVRLGERGRYGSMLGRLQGAGDFGEYTLDEVSESRELAKEARAGFGSVLTHVGEWVPSSGSMTAAEAQGTLSMLHVWFGLLRGAWSGPLFPQGLTNGEVTWRQIAPWTLGDSREVTTWMPLRTPLDLSALFAGFSRRWNDEAWRSPLTNAVWWLVEANARETAMQSRIILAQVALELLAWVHVVETQGLCSRSGFGDLPAADRIRLLLQSLGIHGTIPSYLSHAASLRDNDAYDGPGVITLVRNALVHATDRKRSRLRSLDGATWRECSELALDYVDLVLLAVCGHDGHYARRGLVGWKGDDEVLVPWVKSAS